MERLTMTSNKGGLAFTFDLDITCEKSEMLKILNIGKKLKYYEDMEEQGLLFINPAKIGDTVWCTTSDQYDHIIDPIECIITGFEKDINNKLQFHIHSKSHSGGWCKEIPSITLPDHMNTRYTEDFGVSVFLKFDEADAKIKENNK